MNKTGTSSLASAMQELEYTIGDQSRAEKLLLSWAKRDFKPIIEYCQSANFFQDIPFSLPFTFIAMDQAFPNSKYILSVRNSSEEWYRSAVEYDRVLRKQQNIVPGYSNRLIWNTKEENVLEKERLIKIYEYHNQQVREYFRHRPNDLLVLHLADKDAYQKLCDFLGKEKKRDSMPWLNRTSDIR